MPTMNIARRKQQRTISPPPRHEFVSTEIPRFERLLWMKADGLTGLKLASNSLFGDEPRALQQAPDIDSF
jgi:hypothetical protein